MRPTEVERMCCPAGEHVNTEEEKNFLQEAFYPSSPDPLIRHLHIGTRRSKARGRRAIKMQTSEKCKKGIQWQWQTMRGPDIMKKMLLQLTFRTEKTQTNGTKVTFLFKDFYCALYHCLNVKWYSVSQMHWAGFSLLYIHIQNILM